MTTSTKETHNKPLVHARIGGFCAPTFPRLTTKLAGLARLENLFFARRRGSLRLGGELRLLAPLQGDLQSDLLLDSLGFWLPLGFSPRSSRFERLE